MNSDSFLQFPALQHFKKTIPSENSPSTAELWQNLVIFFVVLHISHHPYPIQFFWTANSPTFPAYCEGIFVNYTHHLFNTQSELLPQGMAVKDVVLLPSEVMEKTENERIDFFRQRFLEIRNHLVSVYLPLWEKLLSDHQNESVVDLSDLFSKFHAKVTDYLTEEFGEAAVKGENTNIMLASNPSKILLSWLCFLAFALSEDEILKNLIQSSDSQNVLKPPEFSNLNSLNFPSNNLLNPNTTSSTTDLVGGGVGNGGGSVDLTMALLATLASLTGAPAAQQPFQTQQQQPQANQSAFSNLLGTNFTDLSQLSALTALATPQQQPNFFLGLNDMNQQSSSNFNDFSKQVDLEKKNAHRAERDQASSEYFMTQYTEITEFPPLMTENNRLSRKNQSRTLKSWQHLCASYSIMEYFATTAKYGRSKLPISLREEYVGSAYCRYATRIIKEYKNDVPDHMSSADICTGVSGHQICSSTWSNMSRAIQAVYIPAWDEVLNTQPLIDFKDISTIDRLLLKVRKRIWVLEHLDKHGEFSRKKQANQIFTPDWFPIHWLTFIRFGPLAAKPYHRWCGSRRHTTSLIGGDVISNKGNTFTRTLPLTAVQSIPQDDMMSPTPSGFEEQAAKSVTDDLNEASNSFLMPSSSPNIKEEKIELEKKPMEKAKKVSSEWNPNTSLLGSFVKELNSKLSSSDYPLFANTEGEKSITPSQEIQTSISNDIEDESSYEIESISSAAANSPLPFALNETNLNALNEDGRRTLEALLQAKLDQVNELQKQNDLRRKEMKLCKTMKLIEIYSKLEAFPDPQQFLEKISDPQEQMISGGGGGGGSGMIPTTTQEMGSTKGRASKRKNSNHNDNTAAEATDDNEKKELTVSSAVIPPEPKELRSKRTKLIHQLENFDCE